MESGTNLTDTIYLRSFLQKHKDKLACYIGMGTKFCSLLLSKWHSWLQINSFIISLDQNVYINNESVHDTI